MRRPVGTLTFAAGQQSQTVTVLVNGDLKVENDETFLVNLSDARLGGARHSAQVSIARFAGHRRDRFNDDSASFSINDVSRAEGQQRDDGVRVHGHAVGPGGGSRRV
jgi:hypothetical protein